MAQIEVRNASGSLLAILTPEDGVKDAYLSRRLNGDCELNFSLPATSEKLQYLTDENLIYCDNRVFVLADPDSVMHVRRDGELWANVQARERWVLLDRVHKTVCNDDNAKPVNDLDVVITKTGAAAGGYTAGSAGSALSHLLAGTGWGVIYLPAPPVWQDLFDADQLATEYTSGGVSPATWSISGGVLTATDGSEAYLVKNSLNIQDCSVVITTDQAARGAIIARFQDGSNYYCMGLYDNTEGGGTGFINIFKRVAGSNTQLASANINFPRGTPATVIFALRGSALEAYFNGVKVLSCMDTTFTSGMVGLRQNAATAGASTRFLDFAVYRSDGVYWSTGQHEIKTSQESVLANVKQAKDLWGGYLVWNSAAKGVVLQSESWQPYSGYAVHLGKNLKGVTRSYDYDVVTKLWVFGQNDVDIFDVNVVHSGTAQAGGSDTITLAAGAASVNGAYIDGVIYITGGTGSGQSRRIIDYNGSTKVATVESNWTTVPDSTSTYEIKARFLLNFGYTNELRSFVWRNQDIIDPSELKAKGQEVHTKLAYPRVHYKVEHVDLRTLTSHAHETFTVGDMVDVMDEELGIFVQVRVIYHRYNVFQPWLCDIELGDESYELKQILAELKKQSRVTYRLGRAPSTIIIASGGTTKNTRRADIIVPVGYTSAQKVINQAIDKLSPGGGKMVLLDGIFVCDFSIKLPSKVALEGQGASTVIKFKPNVGILYYGLIENAGAHSDGSNDDISIFNLCLDGDLANQGSGEQEGIYVNHVTNLKISGIICRNFRGYGLFVRDCDGAIITGNQCHGNRGDNIYLMYTDKASVAGNVCYNSTLGSGICLNRCNENAVSANTCYQNYYCGINLYDGSNGNNVTGNIVRENKQHGIRINGYDSQPSNRNSITANTVYDNGKLQDNTYNGIHIAAYASANTIQSNKVSRGASPTQRYGICINASTCADNIVTNNDLYQSGVSGSLSDSGTGTITTAGNRL